MNTYKLTETSVPVGAITPITLIIKTCVVGTMKQAIRKLYRAHPEHVGNPAFQVVIAANLNDTKAK